MQANSPAKIDTTPGQADYARAVDELLQLYTRIDLAAGALRIVDVPIMRQIVDVPIILATKRATSAFLGEWLAFISIRPLITRVLHWHFHHRLRALRRHILLETAFSEDPAKAALARIDRAIDFWKKHITAGLILFAWIPALVAFAGSVIAVGKSLFPNVDLGAFFAQPLVIMTGFSFVLAVYLLIFFSSAFVVKRGLMLGGKGRDAYYPGLLPGAGGYAREREILGALGLAVSEFPLDLVFIIPVMLGGVFIFADPLGSIISRVLVWVFGDTDAFGSTFQVGFLVWATFFAILILIIWFSRKKLGRC